VIVVTHLPQVAAFAQRHFVVEKEESNSRVAARVAEVTGDARTREIARMLSGLSDSVSGAAHADELLALAANR
jgi:DNA repair protein RecN (Recombination protein N)